MKSSKTLRLLPVTATLTVTLLASCILPTYDDYAAAALEEQQSIWQYLKVYSIYQDSLPARSGNLTPYDMFDLINDRLHGARYTEYVEDRPGGGTMFRPQEFAPPVSRFTDSITIANTMVYLTLPGNTIYFRIPDFSNDALAHFITYVDILSNYENIIFDLRSNGGGFINVSDAIVSEFLPHNTGFIKTRYRDYDKKRLIGVDREEVRRTRSQTPRLLDKNVAILVNRGSASASEIVVAALKDRMGAHIVGETTHGKGLGQVIITRRGRKTPSITFMMISGVEDGVTGEYHVVGIPPDPVNETYMAEARRHWPRDPNLYYAVKLLEPSFTTDSPSPKFEGMWKTMADDIYTDHHIIGAIVKIHESELPEFLLDK